jgi:hypothetical protein
MTYARTAAAVPFKVIFLFDGSFAIGLQSHDFLEDCMEEMDFSSRSPEAP